MNTLTKDAVLKDSFVDAPIWEVRGIEHELFTRVLASLAHKQVSPLSIVRMTTSILKKTVQKNGIQADKLIGYLSKIDAQMDEVVNNTRSIKLWESDSKELGFPNSIIRQASDLMVMRLSFRNIQLNASDLRIEDDKKVNHSRLLYMTLACLTYFEDQSEVASSLSISRSKLNSFAITLKNEPTSQKLEPTEIIRKIDYRALLLLASSYSYKLRFNREKIEVIWG